MESDKAPKDLAKKELFAELDKLKSEVNSIRNGLNKANSDKEFWYSNKEGISGDIRKKIIAIRQNREKRDDLTKRVKELKEMRTKLNDDIKKKISGLAELRKQSAGLMKKAKIKDPIRIKAAVDSIESRLETEAMPFEAEKRLSKQLKALKKSLAEASGVMEALDKIKHLNSKINSAKKESDAVHEELQAIAGSSQALHESILADSRSIDGLKSREEESYEKFLGFKKTFSEKNSILREKLERMGKIRSEINKFQLEEGEKRKLHEAMLIKNKELELEQKIKSGIKLTTDDFLVFQESIKGRK